MGFKFNNESPIYLQIIEDLKMQIIRKQFLPLQKIPSVRELSMIYEVNPNTIQKALIELEDMGLIFTERTNGKFITDNENLINDVLSQSLKNIIDNFYSQMKNMGFDKNQVLDMLNKQNKEDL